MERPTVSRRLAGRARLARLRVEWLSTKAHLWVVGDTKVLVPLRLLWEPLGA